MQLGQVTMPCTDLAESVGFHRVGTHPDRGERARRPVRLSRWDTTREYEIGTVS